jgi:DNA-binding transcriptional MerR regulator
MGELTEITPLPSETTLSLSISEVARETGVSVYTLRYYEKAGLLSVPRTANGRRRYGLAEVSAVKFIDQLRRTGMPIRNIREYADLVRFGNDTTDLRMRLLEEHREAVFVDLAEKQRYLTAITQKIDAYRQMLADDPVAEISDTVQASQERCETNRSRG